MTLRDIRLILAVAISASMMANQTSAGFDVGILRAANRSAQENEPGGETSPLAGNNAPTISAIANRVIAVNGAAIATFVVADKETPGDGLKVEVASDNPAVVDTQRLTLEKQGGKQTLTVVPVPEAEGTATITVTVSDMDGGRTSTQFALTATENLPYVPGELLVRVRPGVKAAGMLREAKAAGARSGASAAAAMAVGGGGLKEIRPLLMGSLENVGAHAAAAEGDPTEREEGAAESLDNLMRTHVLTFDSREDVQDLLEMLQREEGVESVELNDVYRLDYTANDPIYVDGYLWGLEKIRAGRAWDNSPRGDGVVVAVIDSGVAINHPDLTPNMWKNSGEIRGNRVDDDKNGYVDDVDGWDFILNAKTWNGHGHGTHVAGTIAAVGNNREGVIGVAPKAKIMPLKVFSDAGVSNLASSVNAIYYAANKGAKVINLSWGAYKVPALKRG